MISLKDYNLQYRDNFNDPFIKKNSLNKNELPFFYLYPSEIQPTYKNIFTNQKQQNFTITQLQDLQECQKIIQLIHSKQQIFSPLQEFFLFQHKNPNAQKRFLVIASIDYGHTLKNISQTNFCQNVIVPSEHLCTKLIQRIIAILKELQQKGMYLKVITPGHIIFFQDKIYLNYPFPHDLNDGSTRVFQQLFTYEIYCAPQILKVFANSKTMAKQICQIGKNDNISLNSIAVSNQIDVKGFKKSILYSLAFSILSCFGFKIPILDRYSALKNPRYLNNHLNRLRKQIKTHHDGKFISKLMKLMLEHSQSIRDTIGTFLYKMNSAQFQLLRKIESFDKKIKSEQNIPTESEINSHPMLRTSSGKKTIDIRISSMSNASSLINKSWLSISHQNGDKIASPSDSKSFPQQKQNNLQVSKRSINESQLDGIEQQINPPGSPIELDIQWDEDSSVRGSNKSRKSKSKSSSDKQKNEPIIVLLNKISQKQEGQQQIDGQSKGRSKQNQSIQQSGQLPRIETISFDSKSIEKKQLLNKVYLGDDVSKTQLGKKNKYGSNKLQDQLNQIDNRLSQSDNRREKKYPKKQKKITAKQIQEEQNISKYGNYKNQQKQNEQIMQKKQKDEDLEIIQNQTDEIKRNKLKQVQPFKIFQCQNKENKMQNDLNKQKIQIHEPSTHEIYEPSTLVLLNHQSVSLNEDQTNHSVIFNLQENTMEHENHNQSLIFEQPFSNVNEYKAEQKLLKDKKQKQKDKLTQRKKDQYNQRSRIILLTLVVIFIVFKFIQWILSKQQST